MKKRRSAQKEVTASPTKLLEHYKSFFLDNNSDLNSKQQNITSKVADYFGAYMRPQNFPFFTIKNLEDAFKKTKKSNVKGYDTISYQLLLNSNTDITKNILLHFYNSILY